MTDDQSDAVKKAMRHQLKAVDDANHLAARRIAAAVRRNSEDSGADNRFLKGLRISPW